MKEWKEIKYQHCYRNLGEETIFENKPYILFLRVSYINTERGTPLLNQETSESGAIQEGIIRSLFFNNHFAFTLC